MYSWGDMEEGYVETSSEVKIKVIPELMASETNPLDQRYVFAYHIEIENLRSDTIQLIERHWVIHSGGRQIGEVFGPGVVGKQPVLKPGDTYSYTSSAVIEDPVGEMFGSYTFRSESGEFFDATIPKFDLVFLEYLN